MENNIDKKKGIPTPEELGIPSGSYDPVKTIGMEGNFYRGLAKSDKSRPKILKNAAILFALLFFIIPGLFYAFMVFFSEEKNIANLEVVFYALLYTSVGIVIIWDNIRKRHN